MKRNHRIEYLFAIHISDKGLVLIICKEPQKLIIRKQPTQYQMAKVFEQIFHKRRCANDKYMGDIQYH